jgi:hypothetical protein
MRTFPARISYPYCWERLPKIGPEGSAWCRTCCSLPIPPYPHGMRSTLWVKEHTIRTTRTVAALAQQQALQTHALPTSSEPRPPTVALVLSLNRSCHPKWRDLLFFSRDFPKRDCAANRKNCAFTDSSCQGTRSPGASAEIHCMNCASRWWPRFTSVLWTLTWVSCHKLFRTSHGLQRFQ